MAHRQRMDAATGTEGTILATGTEWDAMMRCLTTLTVMTMACAVPADDAPSPARNAPERDSLCAHPGHPVPGQ